MENSYFYYDLDKTRYLGYKMMIWVYEVLYIMFFSYFYGCVCLRVVKLIPGNRRLESIIPMFVIKEKIYIPWKELYPGILFSHEESVFIPE